ncbi:MAG TPA: hypothetical protein VL443_24040 [Cyclobacteriaceae bacterium]|jgi:hypothetical protein|nr:hypothetical protein [Cyclobacteriaceae bacterium]
MKTIESKIDFTRINNDTNGNPRYVCHFLNLLTDKDEFTSLDARYALALSRAKKIGGRKFHNKQYGGWIVFQSYNIAETERHIKELLKSVKP